MTTAEAHKRIWDFFEVNHDEFRKFDRVSRRNRLGKGGRATALMLIGRLLPREPKPTTIRFAEEESNLDYVGVDIRKLAEAASEQDLMDLARCGVLACEDHYELAMYF